MHLLSKMVISQWTVYQLCKSLKNNYSYVLKIFKDVYPELHSESSTHDLEKKSILDHFHKNFTELLKELNEEDLEEEKSKSFQWLNWKESNSKEIPIIDLTQQCSSDVNMNENTHSINEQTTVNENHCESATDIAPVDNQNVSTPLPNNCLTSLPDSNPQTPSLLPTKSLQTTATEASTSTPKDNQLDISKESESQNLILSIQKFEFLIRKDTAEIAAKNVKIKYLKNEINNVIRNQKKISSNLKRLKFRHLYKKIST